MSRGFYQHRTQGRLLGRQLSRSKSGKQQSHRSLLLRQSPYVVKGKGDYEVYLANAATWSKHVTSPRRANDVRLQNVL